MKKILAFILVAVMMLSLVACGQTPDEGKGDEAVANSSVELLDATVGEFCNQLAPAFEMSAEDVKGAFVGGYFSEDETTAVMGGAGATPVDVEDAAAMLKMISLLNDEAFAKVDDGAILYHMMNTNSFAASALHVANADDVDSVASSLKESITGNMWLKNFVL